MFTHFNWTVEDRCLKDIYWIFPLAVSVLQHPQTLQAVNIVKPGLTKAHPTLTCTPRMWLSAWRSRKTSRSRPTRARHLRRGPSGWPRAPCRALTASLTSSRAVSEVFLQNVPVLFIVKTGYYRSNVFSLCPIAPFTKLSYADIVSSPKGMQQSGLARLPLNHNCLIEIIRGFISAWLSKDCSLIKSIPVEIAWIMPSKRPVSEVRLCICL